MNHARVIVVGSGASAVAAAWPLVQAGVDVAMLDVGITSTHYEPLVPARPWSTIRRTDPNQHQYFLGTQAEGIPLGPRRVGSQLTPPRAYVAHDAPTLMPRQDDGFVGLESVALGGLASAWGAAVSPWDDEDLDGMPVSLAGLRPHYDAVAELMGTCGERGDDLSQILHDSPSMMPALRVDHAAACVLERYRRRRDVLRRDGLTLGMARLAACSTEHRGRGPQPYLDMDFWCDHGSSVYRPVYTLRDLLKHPNFRYVKDRLVHTVQPEQNGVSLRVRTLQDAADESWHATRVILGAGAMGSARIVLRSLGRYGTSVPLVTNTSTYHIMLNWHAMGLPAPDQRHSLTQLTGFYRDPGSQRPLAQVQVYSYRSLLTHKLLREARGPMRESLRILRVVLPALSLVGIHHEDRPSVKKSCRLTSSTPAHPAAPADRLEVSYHVADEETQVQRQTESDIRRLFRKLGCFAVSRIDPGCGASIHYGGTLPMRASPKDSETAADGQVASLPGVHVADSAVFPRLSAKGVTFTMMANAHRVGGLVRDALA